MHSFSKAIRLRKKPEFDRTMSSGLRRSTQNLVIIAKEQNGASARLGLVVSRKVGNSVSRNQVKRRIREIFRHSRESLPAWDIVVIARPGAREASFQTLKKDFDYAVGNLRDRASESA